MTMPLMGGGLLSTFIPSWGYMVEHGGTTIWERWDGWVEGRGLGNPGMNSFNHYAIGAVGEWVYRMVGGLNPDPDSPGWKHFNLRPIQGGGLTWAQATYDSIRGRIRCHWEQNESALMVEIEVHTSATVWVPADRNSPITESGQPAEDSPGVSVEDCRDGCAVFRIGSGT